MVINEVRRIIEELSERKKNVVTSENGAGSANKGGQGGAVSKKAERRDNDNGTAATKNKG